MMQQNNCGCSRLSKEQLMNKINEVSFAVVETTLYLDTHPCDEDALTFFRHHVDLRKKLLKEYAAYYGPLLIDDAASAEEKWKWVLQPFPWENKGGGC